MEIMTSEWSRHHGAPYRGLLISGLAQLTRAGLARSREPLLTITEQRYRYFLV